MKIVYDVEDDEDLLLAELERELSNAPPETELPDDIDVEDLGMNDDELLEQEALQAIEQEFNERSKHIAYSVQKDGSLVYQSGSRKDIEVERFLTKEEKDEYTRQHMNLIHHMARKYYDNHSLLEEYDEFYGEASFGFTKALNTYDIASTIPFANYACFCMENVLRTYCERFKRASLIPISVSLDEQIAGDAESKSIGEMYIDPNQVSVHEEVEAKITKEDILEEVSQMDKLLSPVQLFIISTYYGINECEKMTKAQISRTLQMPMNRINVELNAALDKMRTDSRLCNIYL